MAVFLLCGFDTHKKPTPSFNDINILINHAKNGNIHAMDGLAKLYALGHGVEQNFYEGMRWKYELAKKINQPMYSLSPMTNATELAYAPIREHNGSFEKTVFAFEQNMINFLKPYSKGLEQNFNSYIKRTYNKTLNDTMPMFNSNGSASTKYCQLDLGQTFQIPLLLHTHPPTKDSVVVIDIGSGWGACSKQLALLGYKVYSVDIDQRHLDFQKSNFCEMPATDTFLYQYWKVNNPQMLDKHFFKNYCKKIKDKNIVYIAGNFANQKTIKKINKDRWNIVLSLDSLQFMNKKDRDNTFKIVNQHLQEKDIFILKTKRKIQYNSNDPLIYDFDLHNNFHQIFIDYKILSSWIYNSKILGLTLYKN